MTLTLKLTPEKESRLQRQAVQAGLPLDEYVRRLVETAAEADTGDNPPPSRSAANRAAQFLRWAESHGRDTPLLSDEAISREAMYEDGLG